MKKLSRKQWEVDVKNGILHRKGAGDKKGSHGSSCPESQQRRNTIKHWLYDRMSRCKLDIHIDKKRNITINLPEKLNFFENYEETALYMASIRRLSSLRVKTRKDYKLSSVNFDNLKSISTSAALVLTAELSKWDDAIRQKLTPDVCNWNPEILQKLKDLGFFRLFANSPDKLCKSETLGKPNINLVKYIRLFRRIYG